MVKPVVWFLDVDGVLNATRPSWGAPPRQALVRTRAGVLRVRFAPALAVRIGRLCAVGLVQVQWLTTWAGDREALTALEGQLGWSDCPVAAVPGRGEAGDGQWKWRAVRDWVHTHPGQRLIWSDDEAIPGNAATELAEAGCRALLQTTHPRRGLQPPDLDAVEDFVASAGA